MAANLLATIEQRVGSVCAKAPFSFKQATDPFSFALQPTGNIDQVFRIEAAEVSATGGTSFTETRIGRISIFIARKDKGAPQSAYAQLCTDAHSLTAAIVHDGLEGGGDYDVPEGNGRGFSVQHDAGKEYAVLRLTLPVDYESQL